jgi:cytochrome c-type biogenesis protein CcmF
VAAFSCVAFLLGLTGTTLTRSGAVPSVHAFAEDPAIGRALLALVGAAGVGVGVLFVRTRRSPSGRPSPRQDGVGWLLLGQLVVVGTLLAIVFVGTVAPLWSELFGGDDIAIEGRYFARFAGPLAVVGLALVSSVPLVLRAQASAMELVPIGVGLVVGGAALMLAGGDIGAPQLVLGCLAGAACVSAVAGGVGAARSGARVGPHLAHAGVGLLLLGVAGTATGRTESQPVEPGSTISVLGQRVTYEGVSVDEAQDDGTTAVVAEVTVGGQVRHPSLVAYPSLRRLLPETSLVSTPWRDVQVGLVDAADSGTAVIRVGVHPLQMWVWWGGLVIVAAGLVTAWERLRRPGGRPPWAPEISLLATARAAPSHEISGTGIRC